MRLDTHGAKPAYSANPGGEDNTGGAPAAGPTFYVSGTALAVGEQPIPGDDIVPNVTHSYRRPLLLAIVIIAASVFCLPTDAAAADLVGKSMVGARLGPWLSDELTSDIGTAEVRLSGPSTAFHLEMFYLYNLSGPMYLNINLGAVSRGDVRIEYQTQAENLYALGTAGVYPLGAGIDLFPLAGKPGQSVQPFVSAGGSVLFGTSTLRYVSSNYLRDYYGISQDSREALGWYAGAGVDVLLGDSFSLTFSGKYQQAKFGKELLGAKDFSGAQILVGAAYVYK